MVVIMSSGSPVDSGISYCIAVAGGIVASIEASDILLWLSIFAVCVRLSVDLYKLMQIFRERRKVENEKETGS